MPQVKSTCNIDIPVIMYPEFRITRILYGDVFSVTGEVIFVSVFSAAGFLLAAALVWALFLGMRITGKTSGNRNLYRGIHDIRGTVEDTKNELEKHIWDLYKEPMEIIRSEDSVSFVRYEPQPFRRSLQAPFEEICFTVEPGNGDLVRITHTTTLKRFRKNIAKTAAAIIFLVSLPALLLMFHLIAIHVMDAYSVEGYIIPSIRHTRQQLFQAVHIVHLLWPPFLFLALYRINIRNILREYHRIFRNIESIEQ